MTSNSVGLQSIEGSLDSFPYLVLVALARFRDPLREDPDIVVPVGFCGEDSGDIFGGPVVVGHIEGSEPCICIDLHMFSGLFEIQFSVVAFHVRDLP